MQGQSGSSSIVSKVRQPDLESQLMIEHAAIIERLEKLTEEFATHVCVSCERLCQRKSVTRIELSEYAIGSEVWLRLLAYVIGTNPEASSEQLYICKYCEPRIHSNELPCHCSLNELQTVLLCPTGAFGKNHARDCSTKIHASEKVPSICSTYCGRKSCVNCRLPNIICSKTPK